MVDGIFIYFNFPSPFYKWKTVFESGFFFGLNYDFDKEFQSANLE